MNYKAKDIAEFFKQHESKVTHVIVAQTKFRPCRHSQSAIDAMAVQAKKDLRHALNCFAKQLYPKHTSLVQRKPHIYRPLSLVTIENINQTTDEQGNPPNRPKAREVEFSLKEFLREEVKIYRQPDHGCPQTC
jgi:hypothetical protein